MTITFSSILGTAADPLFLAGVEQRHSEIEAGELQHAHQDPRRQHPRQIGALADARRGLQFAEGSAPRQHAYPADARAVRHHQGSQRGDD